MFICSSCGSAWQENYCLACARTIEKIQAKEVSSFPPALESSNQTKTPANVSPEKFPTRAGRNDCPACGSTHTDKAVGKFKAAGFQAFPNRCCFECDAVWKPGCPKWAAILCMIAGGAAYLLIPLMFSGFARDAFNLVLALGPFAYGFAVLLGMGGQMEILSKGKRMEHVRRFERALSSNNPYEELHRLAVSLRDEGVTQIEVYRLFSHFQRATSRDDPKHDPIQKTMESVYGGPWAKGSDIFSRALTEEEIQKSHQS